MNIILLGPPGAGKGTQGTILQEIYGLTKISTGDLVREEIEKNTFFGNSIRQSVESGNYLTDDIILKLIDQKIQSSEKGCIFDGVPRTLHQAEELRKLLNNLKKGLDFVIEIEVDENQLLDRITSRYTCKKCNQIYNKNIKPKQEGICDLCLGTEFIHRADDSEEIIKKRLDIYRDKTKPLIDFYQKEGIFFKVNGMNEVENVTLQIQTIIDLNGNLQNNPLKMRDKT